MIKFAVCLLIFSIMLSGCSYNKALDREIDFPDDENGDVLKLLQKKGFDFSTEHIFDYEHIFRTEKSAQEFADEIRKRNLSANTNFQESVSNWNVTVKVRHEPTHAKISRTEAELNNLAALFGGKKDGWGVLQQIDVLSDL